jgi:hypothetical protein
MKRLLASIPTLGIALCALCCAAPLLALVGLPTLAAALTAASSQLIAAAAVAVGLAGVAAYAVARKTSSKQTQGRTCRTSCGCKAASN